VSVVVLVSGGIDSCALVGHLLSAGEAVQPVYVREGLVWEEAELAHLRRFLAAMAGPGLASLRILELPMGDLQAGHWSLTGEAVPTAESADEAVYLPGRNLVLVAKAAVLAAEIGATRIALGILAGNPFPDATPEFLAALGEAISLGLARPIAVIAPFAGLTKRDVLARAAALPLELTFSCLRPAGERPCGACNKCAERRRAFRECGRADPTPYMVGT